VSALFAERRMSLALAHKLGNELLLAPAPRRGLIVIARAKRN
jgi:hypothetical protein